MFFNQKAKNARLLLGFAVLFGLTTGCSEKIQLKGESPPIFMVDKLPFRIALVTPKELRTKECIYAPFGPLFPAFFSCGSALHESSLQTMSRIFRDVHSVQNIDEATQPWDLALWLKIEESVFFLASETRGFYARISLSYRITDKKSNELFSSKITQEQDAVYLSLKSTQPLLASNDFHHASDIAEPLKLQTAQPFIYVPMNQPRVEDPGKTIQKTLQKIMVRMVEEIMEAHHNGKFTP